MNSKAQLRYCLLGDSSPVAGLVECLFLGVEELCLVHLQHPVPVLPKAGVLGRIHCMMYTHKSLGMVV
jgi:hypothetical protein